MNGFLGARFFLGSLTRAGNLPFRRLCTEQGAQGTVGEMVLVDRLLRGGSRDRALIHGHPEEPLFGAQITGKREAAVAEGARLAAEAGARFVDLNCACPIDRIVRRGLGASLARRPNRVARLVRAMVEAVEIPVTVKLRSGWSRSAPNAESVAAAAVEAGAAGIFIHGRSREDRYRREADWELVARLVAELPVPVIGSGDLGHGPEVLARMEQSGCAAVALARGALVKPWLFRECREGILLDPDSRERLELLRRLVHLSLEQFGRDGRGLARARPFLELQLQFLRRYVPAAVYGRPLGLQERPDRWEPRDELEELWARSDDEVQERLLELAGWPAGEESQG